MIRPDLHIIKMGGKLIDNEIILGELLTSFANIKGDKILIHGGGKSGSEMLERLSIPVKYHEGRRLTDIDTLEVVTMVYAGILSKTIVGYLQALNCNAIGLSGCDNNIILAEKRMSTDIDYGYAGDIISINVDKIDQLIHIGCVPIINPITHDGKGLLLNTNADTISSTLASSMSHKYNVKLFYCFEHQGVLEKLNAPDSLITTLSEEQYINYKNKGIISSGMIPKLTNAYDALKNGVAHVSIGNHIHFNNNIPCTTITL